MLWGRGRGNRTPNLRFWRPMLCQLSYTPFSFAPPASISTRLHIDQIVKPKLRSGWGSLRGRIHRATRDGTCSARIEPYSIILSPRLRQRYALLHEWQSANLLSSQWAEAIGPLSIHYRPASPFPYLLAIQLSL